MLREIKFRAFDKEEKVCVSWDWIKEAEFIYLLDNEDFIPMQYTGLKDKNGVEIYEGDVIQTDGYAPCEIIYEAPKFMALWKNRNNLTWDLQSFVFDEIEVIGNIYENPELLEQK